MDLTATDAHDSGIPPDKSTNHRRIGWGRNLLAGSAVVFGVCALAWTSLGGWTLPKIGPPQNDYYNLLVHGFRKGSLALDVAVPEAMKNAENPWDPGKRPPGIAMHDVSYYKGRYFVYFGVVPAVLVFWPFRALVGSDLPLALGSLLFAIGAYLVTAGLWLSIVRRHLRHSGSLTEVFGILALGLAGGQWVLARRVAIWEPAITAGHCFMVCFAAAGYAALCARAPARWLALAGFALGLAVGCRPTLVVGGAALAALAAAVARRAGGFRSTPVRLVLKNMVVAGVPLALVMGGLLWYNDARFGNPLEFGLNYQLSSNYEAKARHFALAFLPANFSLYFLSWPHWGRYFPFLHPIAWRPTPKGYYGYEYVYGALIVYPVILWALALPFFARRSPSPIALFTGLVAIAAAFLTAVLLCFNTAAARYETDFLPWWVWLGLLGWVSLENRVRDGALARGASLLFACSAAFSCVMALCASSELHGQLEFANPAAYHRIAHFFDEPAAAWERLSGYRGGPVAMTVEFPRHPSATFEPLVVTGVEYQKDYVAVRYGSERSIQFCYLHPNDSLMYSEPVAIEPGHSYPVTVEFGALYPPAGHPLYDGWADAEIDSLKHWVRIVFDGRVVLLDRQAANESSPGSLKIGWDDANYLGRRFSGRISEAHRPAWTRNSARPSLESDLELTLGFPPWLPADIQPLLEAYRNDRADILGLRMLDGASVCLVYESRGQSLVSSPAMAIEHDRTESYRIRLGSLLDPPNQSPPMQLLRRSVVVWKGEVPIWWVHAGMPVGPSPESSLLYNVLDSTAMLPAFMGRLVSATGVPVVSPWHPGPFRSVELTVVGRGSDREPLVITGVPGRADTLGIDWLRGGRARLVYDHWGGPLLQSGDFPWSQTTIHRLLLETPAMADLDSTGAPEDRPGRLEAALDGREVWSATVRHYPAASSSVVLGRNSVNSSVMAPELTCAVLSVAQRDSP